MDVIIKETTVDNFFERKDAKEKSYYPTSGIEPLFGCYAPLNT